MSSNQTQRQDSTSNSGPIGQEFANAKMNGRVGTRLLSESDRVRVWEVRLSPGQRLPAHRHVLDYFWTCVSGGRAASRTPDGSTREFTYSPGETRHMRFGDGESMIHDLDNIGPQEIVFVTVEFLQSANPPLPLGEFEHDQT